MEIKFSNQNNRTRYGCNQLLEYWTNSLYTLDRMASFENETVCESFKLLGADCRNSDLIRQCLRYDRE